MGLQFRKAKMALNFREGKPEVYKLRQIVFPAVTTDQLVAECANSCGVNPSQTKAVIDALVNRLVHYMAIGHGVKMGEFGSFKPTFTSKTVKALNDLDGDEAIKTIKVKKIQFYPGKAFTQMLDSLSVSSAGEALDVKE
ncbi:MAG: HU family DNA-binding protein [Prevotellaceae bacterium]|jgi:predicted histone-like DNA-binding protein|nr:HU family DNA-binding protein [Bacteroidaceae bacterium]MBR1492886.1 HU family DNA-binding protein [Bacteroidaceae bacterium]MDD6016419.1 HU family DNA-binding protein [Prevotellaceae bacterium]MDY6257696.1 HU family DNA-binding protein [Bacteroidaceae bacterium]